VEQFIIQYIRSLVLKLPGVIKSVIYNKKEVTLFVNYKSIFHLLFFCKNHTNTQYEVLVDLTAVDYLSRKSRFDLVYHLLSIKYNSRLRIKVLINELDYIASSVPIYSSAG